MTRSFMCTNCSNSVFKILKEKESNVQSLHSNETEMLLVFHTLQNHRFVEIREEIWSNGTRRKYGGIFKSQILYRNAYGDKQRSGQYRQGKLPGQTNRRMFKTVRDKINCKAENKHRLEWEDSMRSN